MKYYHATTKECIAKSVKESNDHSETFFQCKAYTYFEDIKLTGKEKVQKYKFDL